MKQNKFLTLTVILLMLVSQLTVFYFISIVMATTTTLRPNAEGDLLQADIVYPSTPSTHYDKVDEETSDADATYVGKSDTTDVGYYTDLYNLPDGQIPSGSTVNSVAVYIVVRNVVSGVGGYRTTIKTNGVVYNGTAYSPAGTTWYTYSTNYTTNPNTGVAWTIAQVDALQIGVQLIGEYYASSDTYLYGRCTQVYVVIDYTPAGDTISPTYSNTGTNTTVAGQPCQFSVLWNDNVNVSGFIFGTNNTGAWVNDTWVSFTVFYNSTAAWSNVTKTLNSTIHIVIQWQIWANDTSNNWNTTGTQTLTTTGTLYSSVAQSLSISPIPSRQSTYNRVAFQPLQILLEVSRHLSLTRIANQLVDFIASATRQTSYTRVTSQPLTFITETTLQKILARYTSQMLTILTETSRQTSYNRLTVQALTLLQVATRQLTQSRTANQPVTVLTQATRFTSYQRASSTPLSIIADALRTLSTPRTASQIVTVLTEASRTATYSRTASQMLSALTQTARQLTLPRSPAQTLSILTATSRSQTFQRTVSQILTVLFSATRQVAYTRPVSQPLNFLTTSTIAKIIGRTASQVLTILTQTTRQLTLNRFVSQPLNILLSATRQASYSRTAEVLLQINTQTAIKFIIYVIPPVPPITLPTVKLDLIAQTAHITSLWWQKTTTIQALIINKGTFGTDVTFSYAIIDSNNNIIIQGTQTVFVNKQEEKTLYINISTPSDGIYTIQFRTAQPVKVEAKSTLIVETPFYGRLSFTILIVFLLALAIYAVKKRRR